MTKCMSESAVAPSDHNNGRIGLEWSHPNNNNNVATYYFNLDVIGI